jgi:diacylglycerol O-acyltransferase / wax synthase
VHQLNPWDAAFLYLETQDAPQNICGVSHFAPDPHGQRLTLDEVRSAVTRRLPLLPPFRQRLARVPFGLARPYWADDPDVDIDSHLYEVTLPPPGNRLQLAEQVARIAARPLDLSRPPWEIHLIGGLEGGQAALVTKYHHAAVDGLASGEILTTLLDPAPDSPQIPARDAPQPGPVPGASEMLLRGLADAAGYPVTITQSQQRMMTSMQRMLGLACEPGQETWRRPPASPDSIRPGGQAPMFGAPPTPFNGTLTPNRCWAFGQVPLDQVKGIKNALGGTVNDVVGAICAAALRRWLLDRGALPKEPLVAMLPVSLRTDEDRGTFGNRVSMMLAALPTTLADPVQRLRAASAALGAAKRMHSAMGGDFLADALRFVMPMMAAPAYRMAAEMPTPSLPPYRANLYISNVPGPPGPLYLAGKQMLTLYPAAFLPRGVGLNMVVLGYLGSLDFGLMACPDLVPDVGSMMDHVIEAAGELAEAAEGARTTHEEIPA